MEYKKLFFTDEDKAEIRRLREELKNIVVDQEVLSETIAGSQGVVGCGPACGAQCEVTCAHYCQAYCEGECKYSCSMECMVSCEFMCNGLFFNIPDESQV